MSSNYYISIQSKIERKTVYVENVTIDEIVSMAITLFDKFSTHVFDNVIIYKKVSDPVRAIPVRLFELREGNKIHVEAY